MKQFLLALCIWTCVALGSKAQSTLPLVAIHDSELTRALESVNAVAPTPSGIGTTGKEWWVNDWHYFVMPEALKEALRSDGTPFDVVGDTNIAAGILLSNGAPRYPIVISLASEAIRNDEIAAFTNYVAAGGFLFVGSSSFTRNTNGTTRGDFAFGNELGIHMLNGNLVNWTTNSSFTKTNQSSHRLVSHIPDGQLTWRMPSSSEEIPWGISPSHPFLAPHDIWQVQASDATVLAQSDITPFLTVKAYGKGFFIYYAPMQPLIGHSGFAPSMYAYVIFKKAIEWAFENQGIPVGRLSPWPYQYDAAFMVRHDLENFTNSITNIEASAQVEFTNGAFGDYYFCTGTLRDDASPYVNTNAVVASLRRAVTNYGATLGPHNGGLKNPNNASLVRGQYDYWHWGPDEAMDVTPAGYPSGKAYAQASLSNSFNDIESWLSGITNGVRTWVACYFNATREASYDIQAKCNVNIAGDQKLTPFPHWTLSTQTSGKRYSFLSEPVGDWFVNGLVAQSLEPWHPPGVQTSQTLHDAIDYYYGIGGLINFYSHTMSTGLGDAGALELDYIRYSLNTNGHPRLWSTNGLGVYRWWMQRSNAQVSVSCSTNGAATVMTFLIAGSQSPNTAVEALLPAAVSSCSVQVLTNGVAAGTSSYRTNGQLIRVQAGTTVTNVTITYYAMSSTTQVYAENFDTVTAPALPTGWTSSASGAEVPWTTQTTIRDTSPNAASCPDASNIGLSDLVSPVIAVPAGSSILSFKNNYDLETGSGTDAFDGGVLEIKIGTNAFADIIAAGGSFVTGGYTGVIDTNYSNPLAGRSAWSGTSSGFVSTLINLPAGAAGQNVQFRWRCGSDNANAKTGWRIDSISISNRVCGCCLNGNSAPVLPTQANSTMDEMTTLTVTNTATDSDIPANILTYSLLAAPTGAAIDGNGIITWTPTAAQGPSTNTFTTRVVDNAVPPLSATNSFTVVVNEINGAPTLPAQTNRTINEFSTLIVTNTAMDPNLPATVLTYRLLAAPTNAVISTNGVITWTPIEGQGPFTNTITTVVSNFNQYAVNSQRLSATNSFQVVVNDINVAPVLPAQSNRTIAPLTSLVVTNTATDFNLPAATLSYGLVSAPPGASIDANGVITWTPTLAQDQTTNLIRTVVTNFNPYAVNSQHLTTTNSFNVIVNGKAAVAMDTTTLIGEGCIPTNNAIDPGESVTVLFFLKNTGPGNTTNLVASLLATNGVTSPSGPQNYGTLLAGGASVSQPFTFTATGSCGSTITALFQLQDGNVDLGNVSASFVIGPVSTVLTQNFDLVTTPSLPAGWTTSSSGVESNWVTTTTSSDTPTNSAYSPGPGNIGLNELVSPSLTLPNGPAQLFFRHKYSFEADTAIATNGYDGGVLELKIGTNAFVDIITNGGVWVTNGYNRKIDPRYGNPLTNRWSWSGTNAGFVTTTVTLPAAAAGKTVQFRWRAGTDNGNNGGGWWIDTISISGYACCVNGPPILGVQTNRTILEMTTLVITNAVTDPGIPANPVTYSLLNPPAGAVIDSNGIITWTPNEAQGPGTNVITTVAMNSGVPTLATTNSFTVVVQEQNRPPVLPSQPDVTLSGLQTLSVNNTATDPDIPANMLTYALLMGPANAVIDTNGIISWTPVASQVPSTNPFTTVVTDNSPSGVNAQHLSATNTFTVVVHAIHNGPVLPAQGNRIIAERNLLIVTNTASDSDIPITVLSYSLLAAPAGAAIDASGVITWTPGEAQGPSTNVIVTRVTDDGNPQLSGTNSFQVVVNEVNSPPVLPVQTNRTIDQSSTLTVTNAATDPDLPANLLSYSLLAAPAGAAIDGGGVITWHPSEGQGSSTNIITTWVVDDGVPPLSATNSFFVIVKPQVVPPTILSLVMTNSQATVAWSSTAGMTYRLQYLNTLGSTNWTDIPGDVSATGSVSSATTSTGNAVQRLYRILVVP